MGFYSPNNNDDNNNPNPDGQNGCQEVLFYLGIILIFNWMHLAITIKSLL